MDYFTFWAKRLFRCNTLLRGLTASLLVSMPYALSVQEIDDTDDKLIDLNAPVVDSVGDLAFRDCRISSQGRDRKVQCAWYEVAENPLAPEAKKIRIFVARIPAKRHVKNIHDPVLFFAGGPGQSASESFLFADHMWPALSKNRDFYLIDQRGTGQSNFMGCDELTEQMELAYSEYDSDQIKTFTRECLAELPGDARYYTTDITVKDLEEVRKALGVEEWNAIGVSYGTRVATHYMRSFPDSLRTVVLDSVIPPTHILGSEIAMRSQNMLAILFERCRQSSGCEERMEGLEKDVGILFDQLKAAPVKIKVENFRTGEIEETEFSYEHLVTLVRMYLYSPDTMALLPPMLHEAAKKGNFSPIARAAAQTAENLQNSISVGLHNSVMCTEEFPYFNKITSQDRLANERSYMGLMLLDMIEDICSVWPTGEVPQGMKDALKSDIPTLVLSGEFDPITPPEYAEETVKALTQGKHLQLKGQGHFVGHTGCMPFLIEKFVNAKSSEGLDVECLKRLHASPLYLNLNGTAP